MPHPTDDRIARPLTSVPLVPNLVHLRVIGLMVIETVDLAALISCAKTSRYLLDSG